MITVNTILKVYVQTEDGRKKQLYKTTRKVRKAESIYYYYDGQMNRRFLTAKDLLKIPSYWLEHVPIKN